jgi:hypothetical protein
LEQRGEDTIFRALDTLSAHIQWILVTGSEAMLGGAKSLFGMAGSASTTGVSCVVFVFECVAKCDDDGL